MAKAYCDDCLNGTTNRYWSARIEKRPAEFLCYDCEKYLCSDCINKHTDHLTFSVKDMSNKTKLDHFCKEMIEQLTSEGDKAIEKFKKERIQLCGVVDVGRSASVMGVCILRGSKKWAVTFTHDRCIKVFNINNNKMTDSIDVSHEPWGITEVTSTNPSQSLIGVSFPDQKRINIMNIQGIPARVVSSINIRGKCYDLAYCNNKLITLCMDSRNGVWNGSIHVLDMSGQTINIIDISKLLDVKPKWFDTICMSVHSESETIYVCNYIDPSCVISLSLDGQVLHYIKFTDMNARRVCVGGDQTVYVTGDKFPLYKLPSDLWQRETVIKKEIVHEWFPQLLYFTAIAYHADTFYIARSDGRVYIIRHE